MSRKISVKRAAQLLGKRELFVRECMKRGTLPIGTAEQMPGSTRWSFSISPQALADYMGCSVRELYEDERPATDDQLELSEEQIEKLWRAFVRALSEEGVKA